MKTYDFLFLQSGLNSCSREITTLDVLRVVKILQKSLKLLVDSKQYCSVFSLASMEVTSKHSKTLFHFRPGNASLNAKQRLSMFQVSSSPETWTALFISVISPSLLHLKVIWAISEGTSSRIPWFVSMELQILIRERAIAWGVMSRKSCISSRSVGLSWLTV